MRSSCSSAARELAALVPRSNAASTPIAGPVVEHRHEQRGAAPRRRPAPRRDSQIATATSLDPLRPAALEHLTRGRSGDRDRGAPRAPVACPALAATTSSSPSRSMISTVRASTSARPRLTISSSTRSRSAHAADRVGDVARRLERAHRPLGLVPAALAALVQARVLDRGAGPLGEDHCRLLVRLGELAAALLLGQVQVAPGPAADQDRDAQEAVHRRVARREAVALRMLADVGSRSGRGSSISTPSTPRPRGSSPIARCVAASMPTGQEALELARSSSSTPSAAYRAPVISQASSRIRSSTVSGSSSPTSARPTSRRRRSLSRLGHVHACPAVIRLDGSSFG